jgi:hypothetical protein
MADAGISQDGLYRYWLIRDWSPLTMQPFIDRFGPVKDIEVAWDERIDSSLQALRMNTKLAIIMLNPSTADGQEDDPTIRKCMGFAGRWGFGGIQVCNLFAWRATDPKIVAVQFFGSSTDVVGPMNDRFIRRMGDHGALVGNPIVLCAWGSQPWLGKTGRAAEVVKWFKGSRIKLACLGTTQDGSPRHPLYVPYTQLPMPFGELTS